MPNAEPLQRTPAPMIENALGWVRTRYDGCPACLIHDIPPQLWAITGETLVCVYQCTRCRHAWWTSWSIPPVEGEAAA